MKIAISATGRDLDAEVDPRLGRCEHFIIVDPQSMEFEAVDNSSATAAGGAGIGAGQMIAGKDVELVLTGNCGPNAYQTLSAAGIQVITGVSGRIRDAVEAYKAGKLQRSTQPNVGPHSGMGMGRGTGRGRGMGPGMMPPTVPQAKTPDQEIETLKSQTQMVAQQLSELQRRIEELERKR